MTFRLFDRITGTITAATVAGIMLWKLIPIISDAAATLDGIARAL